MPDAKVRVYEHRFTNMVPKGLEKIGVHVSLPLQKDEIFKVKYTWYKVTGYAAVADDRGPLGMSYCYWLAAKELPGKNHSGQIAEIVGIPLREKQ